MTLDQLEERLGVLLGIGTNISSFLLAIGLGLWVVLDDQPVAAWAFAAGLIALIATPIGRVIVSAVGFALQRDWQMLGMTALVLASLFASLVFALRP